MERATKLMATTKQTDDRFSDLPDEIVYQILSHLPMKDLARLGTLSKRCRELCISNPTLFFCTPRTRSKSRQRRFYNFLDWLLARRHLHKVKTQRFLLHCFFLKSFEKEEYRVKMWLQHVVNSSVEDICLEIFDRRKDFSFSKAFSFPPAVLGCKSLRSLKINAHNQPLLLPSSLSVPPFADKLQVFELKGVYTNNKSLGEWFSSFKSLRVLKLDGVSGIKAMTISNSSVETLIIANCRWDPREIDILKLQNLHHLFINVSDCLSIKISAPKLQSLSIIWVITSSGRTSLEISAPNLQTFQWFGNVVDDYCMENCPNLSYASVALLPRQNSDHASTKHSLEKVLDSICGAKSLTLWNDFVRVLYMHDCLPFLFGNVEHLAIRGISRRIKPLFSLLGGTIDLKHLILVKNLSPSKTLFFEMKYEQSQNLRFTHLLKTATVEFFDGKNEVEQIKHVLKDVKEWEMAILSTSTASQDFTAVFKEFMIPFP